MYLGARTLSVQVLDHRRRIVHLEPIAFALRRQCVLGGIRRGVGSGDLQVIRAVGHRRSIPGIELVLDLVLQQLPVLLPLATVEDGVNQVVVILIPGAPHHRLPALLREPLWRRLEPLWLLLPLLLLDGKSAALAGRGRWHVQLYRLCSRPAGRWAWALDAHARAFEHDGVNRGCNILRQVRETHPGDAGCRAG